MWKRALEWLRRPTAAAAASARIVELPAVADGRLLLEGRAFDLAAHADRHDGLPHPRWDALQRWLDGWPGARHADIRLAAARTWLGWLQQALGPDYRARESPRSLLLGVQPPRQAALTLDYLDTTQRRVARLLEDLAADDARKQILIVFHDADTYYRYVSAFRSADTEATPSAGMYIDHGCGHFVTYDTDLSALEPVIVHEMTHSLLGHRALPLWLHEGMAVNTEARFGHRAIDGFEAQRMLLRHRAFWTDAHLEDFWRGRWHRAGGDADEFFYDLARILVAQLADDWPAFKRFVRAAGEADAGRAAAAAEFGVDLDGFVRLLLGDGPAHAR